MKASEWERCRHHEADRGEEGEGVWSAVPTAERQGVPNLELISSCPLWPVPAHRACCSAWGQPGKRRPQSTRHSCQTVTLSIHWDPSSRPRSFKWGKDWLPKLFTAISKAHTARCYPFINRNSSIIKLDTQTWQLHIAFDFVLNKKSSELRP